MKNKLNRLLNYLIEISAEDNTLPIDEELDIINSEIAKTKIEINNLKTVMESSTRYYDEDAVALDKSAIKSLEKKIEKAKKNNELINEDVKILKEKSDLLLDKLTLARSNLEKYGDLLSNLTTKLIDKNINTEYYNNLIEKNSERLDYWGNLEKKHENERNKVVEEIDIYYSNKENNDVEIRRSTLRLEELMHSLSNELNYVNISLKNDDTENLKVLENKVAENESKFDVLNNSVRMLAFEFMNLIDENRPMYAYKKLDELILKIENIPYVKDNNFVDLESNLNSLENEELTLRKNIKKDNFLNDYAKTLHQRLTDMNRFMEDNRLRIIDVRKKINRLNKVTIKELSEKINSLDFDEEMLARYNSDLNHVLKYSIILKNNELDHLFKYKKKLQTEVNEISKKIFDKEGLIDEERKEAALLRHKEVVRDIDNIKKRLNKKLDISEIKSSIELILGTMNVDYKNITPERSKNVKTRKKEVFDNYPGMKFLKVIKTLDMNF